MRSNRSMSTGVSDLMRESAGDMPAGPAPMLATRDGRDIHSPLPAPEHGADRNWPWTGLPDLGQLLQLRHALPGVSRCGPVRMFIAGAAGAGRRSACTRSRSVTVRSLMITFVGRRLVRAVVRLWLGNNRIDSKCAGGRRRLVRFA